MGHPVKRFRYIALIEGLSFLLLLFVSMPLKYYYGMAGFSYAVGMAHGVLFVIYVLLAIDIVIRHMITGGQFLRVLIASLIPFGTFFNDKMLVRQEQKFA